MDNGVYNVAFLRMMPMMATAIILGHYVIKDCWGLPYTFWDGGMYMYNVDIYKNI